MIYLLMDLYKHTPVIRMTITNSPHTKTPPTTPPPIVATAGRLSLVVVTTVDDGSTVVIGEPVVGEPVVGDSIILTSGVFKKAPELKQGLGVCLHLRAVAGINGVSKFFPILDKLFMSCCGIV